MALDQEIEDFLAAFRSSGLSPKGGETDVLAELAGQGVKPPDARGLAEEFVRRQILTAWQAEMLRKGKHRGFHLGPHILLQPLGHGAMGSVFLARHTMLDRHCAIKVLPGKYREDPDFLRRFQIEARATAALDHPNIVRVYDFNHDTITGNEIYYLVMEYVDGHDLQRMVAKAGPLDYQRAADLIRQAALGLAHAHESGFVHRDVKPANLLVDSKGILKILDLGLAQFASEARNASQAEPGASGTPDYIAPEQIAGAPDLDGRADIYSLGLTFYFLLVGHQPFTKQTALEILRAQCSENPPPIVKRRPDIPFELTSIFEKMTAKSPQQRFKTAGAVAAALQKWIDNAASGQSSRLSGILRVAALRAKQNATVEPDQVAPRTTASVDLELAPVDEQASQPTLVMRADSTVVHLSQTNEKNAQPQADRGQTRTVAKPALIRAMPLSSPVDPAATAAIADLLPDLPFGPDPSQPLPKTLHAVSQGGQSPWRPLVRAACGSRGLWAGVGGLFIAGVVVFFVFAARSPQRLESPSSVPAPASGIQDSSGKAGGAN